MTFALHAAVPRVEAAYSYYVDTHASRAGECESWVDWYGEVVCDAEELRKLVGVETIEAAESEGVPGNRCVLSFNFVCRRTDLCYSTLPHPKLLPFDHVLPSPESTLARPPRTAVLYTTIPSPSSSAGPSSFRALHEVLYSASTKTPEPHVEYVLRHVPPANHATSAGRTYLSGYGVALDLKKTDYLALDDRRLGASPSPFPFPSTSNSPFSIRDTNYRIVGSDDDATDHDDATHDGTFDTDPVLALLHQYPDPEQVTAASEPLTSDELMNIGLQAAQLLHDASLSADSSSSSGVLNVLKTLSQNFPVYASGLARRVVVHEGLETEAGSNQVKAQGGINAAWLNGAAVGEGSWDAFGSVLLPTLLFFETFLLLSHFMCAVRDGSHDL